MAVNDSGSQFRPTERWQVAVVARVDGKAPNPEAALTNVSGAALMPDGTLVVGQPQERLLRAFDAEGRFLRTIGRPGKGPGEFESVGPVGHIGDTLYVIDHRNARALVYPRLAAPPAMIRLPILTAEGSGYGRLEGLLAHNGAVSGRNESDASGNGRSTYYLHDRVGGRRQAIASAATDENFVRIPTGPGGGSLGVPQPFVARPSTPHSPASGMLVQIIPVPPQDDRASGELKLSWIRGDGQRQDRSVGYSAIPLRRAHADSVIDAFAESIAQSLTTTPGVTISKAGIAREANARFVRPRYLPPFRRAYLDDDARLWLDEYGNNEWFVIHPDGKRIAAVALPPKVQILAARGSTLWLLQRDEFDIPVLVKFSLSGA